VQNDEPEPKQQLSPSVPQVKPPPPVHAPMSQVVVPPHISVSPAQVPRMQQPPIPQLEEVQQGSPSPPQDSRLPSSQTMPLIVGGSSPSARQDPALQQLPPLHVSLGQQTSPGKPQATQAPAAASQVPTPQGEPSATQTSAPPSQQPVVHESPAQQGSPAPPHG